MNAAIKVFVMNLGKYNEGYIDGEWIDLPISNDKMQEVFKSIQIGDGYEELCIADSESSIYNLSSYIGEFSNLSELNYLADRIEDLNPYDLELFEALIETENWAHSIKDLINLIDNLDIFSLIDAKDNYDLGYYWLVESGCYNLSNLGFLENYIDYEAYGRDIAIEQDGWFVANGYIYSDGSSIEEFYSGIDDIPDKFLLYYDKNDDDDEDEEDGGN